MHPIIIIYSTFKAINMSKPNKFPPPPNIKKSTKKGIPVPSGIFKEVSPATQAHQASLTSNMEQQESNNNTQSIQIGQQKIQPETQYIESNVPEQNMNFSQDVHLTQQNIEHSNISKQQPPNITQIVFSLPTKSVPPISKGKVNSRIKPPQPPNIPRPKVVQISQAPQIQQIPQSTKQIKAVQQVQSKPMEVQQEAINQTAYKQQIPPQNISKPERSPTVNIKKTNPIPIPPKLSKQLPSKVVQSKKAIPIPAKIIKQQPPEVDEEKMVAQQRKQQARVQVGDSKSKMKDRLQQLRRARQQMMKQEQQDEQSGQDWDEEEQQCNEQIAIQNEDIIAIDEQSEDDVLLMPQHTKQAPLEQEQQQNIEGWNQAAKLQPQNQPSLKQPHPQTITIDTIIQSQSQSLSTTYPTSNVVVQEEEKSIVKNFIPDEPLKKTRAMVPPPNINKKPKSPLTNPPKHLKQDLVEQKVPSDMQQLRIASKDEVSVNKHQLLQLNTQQPVVSHSLKQPETIVSVQINNKKQKPTQINVLLQKYRDLKSFYLRNMSQLDQLIHFQKQQQNKEIQKINTLLKKLAQKNEKMVQLCNSRDEKSYYPQPIRENTV